MPARATGMAFAAHPRQAGKRAPSPAPRAASSGPTDSQTARDQCLAKIDTIDVHISDDTAVQVMPNGFAHRDALRRTDEADCYGTSALS